MIKLKDLKVTELKELLRERGLKLSGKKSELVVRLQDYEDSKVFKENNIGLEESLKKERLEDTLLQWQEFLHKGHINEEDSPYSLLKVTDFDGDVLHLVNGSYQMAKTHLSKVLSSGLSNKDDYIIINRRYKIVVWSSNRHYPKGSIY